MQTIVYLTAKALTLAITSPTMTPPGPTAGWTPVSHSQTALNLTAHRVITASQERISVES